MARADLPMVICPSGPSDVLHLAKDAEVGKVRRDFGTTRKPNLWERINSFLSFLSTLLRLPSIAAACGRARERRIGLGVHDSEDLDAQHPTGSAVHGIYFLGKLYGLIVIYSDS